MKKLVITASVLASVAILIAIGLVVKPRAGRLASPITASSSMPIAKAISNPVNHPPKSIPAAPRSVEQDKAIQEIRSELQVVMDLNKKINATQQTKSAQILRIQEQAEIHQKILAEIQKISPQTPAKMPSRETLLAQEKLRIIREETMRNKKLLEDTTRKTAA